ncbi:MAG: hypothetical protein OEM02_07645 [Desulfobulbaceae bacterium]|nr:hypothetical protein [Desulfobulbaceae bacterium]
MRRKLFWIYLLAIFIASLSYTVQAQVLTINDGTKFTINGGTLDVNCQDILIKSGGTLELLSGGILDKAEMFVEPGGNYNVVSGTVLSCEVSGSVFYFLYKPDGTPAAIFALPKK